MIYMEVFYLVSALHFNRVRSLPVTTGSSVIMVQHASNTTDAPKGMALKTLNENVKPQFFERLKLVTYTAKKGINPIFTL